jgi:3-dehydroquinate synthetase
MTVGEEQKTMDTVLQICNELLLKNYDRHDCILGLGGGVVGDVAGLLQVFTNVALNTFKYRPPSLPK